MKTFNKIIFSALLFTIAGSANAIIIDFKADANINERGYVSLNNYSGLSITGTATDDDDSVQHAYMDSRSGGLAGVANGGLGVCKDLTSGNQCTPSSDDNVTNNETLHFMWDANILITNIWFNNNHDGNYSLEGNKIAIEGDNYLFTASDFVSSRSSGDGTLADAIAKRNADFLYSSDRSVGKNTSFDISFLDDQFYVSAIEYETVPEPSLMWLLGSGLVLLGFARQKKA